MKPSTLKHIVGQLRLLRTVISNYVALYPYHTILISIEVALQNIDSNGNTSEMEDRLYKTETFINSVYLCSKEDHFLRYIMDEVNMIITGNTMAEDIDDIMPDNVCEECGGVDCHTLSCSKYIITATYAELKPDIREENGIQIIDADGSLWVRECNGDTDDPTDNTIYKLVPSNLR